MAMRITHRFNSPQLSSSFGAGRYAKLSASLLQHLPALVVGVVIGGLFVLFLSTASPPSSSSSILASSQDLRRSSSERSKGWNDIHVFYGEESGLQVDPNQKWFAQIHQDEIVHDLLDQKKGYFIDLAANDAKDLSNTIALERLGWDGLCIEPNPVYWYGLSHRKCTVVGALVGGDTTQQVDVKFRGVYGGIVGKMDEKRANFKREPKSPIEKRYTAPLTQVLEKFNVPTVIDYLSLDVEGAEYLVMQHFPFETYKFKILTVERPDDKLKALLNQNGYIHLKDLAWWGETLWAHKSTGLSPTHPKIVKIQTEERN